jgi:AraC-like DNA-binding protein
MAYWERRANDFSRTTKLNFSDFIKSYRIELAKQILKSPEFSKHIIDAIAKKAGFNSKSPFYIAFRKHTGMKL